MAGKPITRAYLERVEQVGVQNILNRLAGGESIAAVARGIATSRQFLSTFLNSTPEGADAVALAREIAAATGPKSKGSGTHSEPYGWAKESAIPHFKDWTAARLSLSHSGPRGAERAQASHLVALKQLRIERLEPDIPNHQVTTAPQNQPTPPAST